MPVSDKIDESYEPWKMYHGKNDKLSPTHSLIEVDGPLKYYNMAIEIPNEQVYPIIKLMQKEADASNRFSLTDGLLQGEFELWDGDYEKRLYFCVDFTLDQAIKFANQKDPTIGYVPVGVPNVTAGGQQIFRMNDLRKFIIMKRHVDTRPDRPNTWKVG
jgi:hypothetical protein